MREATFAALLGALAVSQQVAGTRRTVVLRGATGTEQTVLVGERELKKKKEKKKKSKQGGEEKRKDDENATGEDQGATGEDILAGGSRQDFVGGVGVQPVSTTTTNAIKTRHLPAMAVKYTLGEGNILSGVPSKEDLMELSEVTKMAMESKLISWFDEKYGLDYSGYSDLEVGGAVSSHADGVIIYSPKVHFFKGEKVAGADRLAQEIFGLFSDSTDYITTLNGMTLNNEFSKTVSVEYKLVEYAP